MTTGEPFVDAPPSGTVVGDYVLDEALGQGGFAITYRAHHSRLTRQQVAVKEYFPEALARRSQGGEVRSTRSEFVGGRNEFFNGGQRLAELKHRHIVRVVNFFEANGTAYLVMEYEPGRSLETSLRDGWCWEESRLRVLAQKLLDALLAVHALGLLHRDINPSNIWLREGGEPLLIDFGAARSELTQRTRAVTSVVTDGYSPTEQYGTLAKAQGPWTDLYALGATLYQIVPGERPVSAMDRKHEVDEGEPDPLPAATELAKGRYSADLLQWIDGLLAVNRAQRPQTAGEALRELQKMTRPEVKPSRHGMRKINEVDRWSTEAEPATARPAAAPEPDQETVKWATAHTPTRAESPASASIVAASISAPEPIRKGGEGSSSV